MGDELDRASAGSEPVIRLVHGRDSLLPLSARGEAWHHRLGPGEPRARRHGAGRSPQASVRLLLHQIFLALARRADRLPDDQDGADRVRVALDPAVGAVSRIVSITGSTPSATTAIMIPGAVAQPVRSTRSWAA